MLLNSLKKIAGILHSPKPYLAKDVWKARNKGEFPKIRPNIRSQILQILQEFLPAQDIKEVVVLGSITGYKYDEHSDIDINVLVDNYDPSYKELRKAYNGRNAHGTSHPINFFVLEWTGRPSSWQDSFFGVYDLLEDKWIVMPPPPETYKEPGAEFPLEIQMAQHISNHFNLMVDDVRDDLNRLNRYKQAPVSEATSPELKEQVIKRKEGQLKSDILQLKEFVDNIETKRKQAYRIGFGVPRSSFPNLLYKLIEYGPNASVFDKLQHMKPDKPVL